jgi:hypothetical protein
MRRADECGYLQARSGSQAHPFALFDHQHHTQSSGKIYNPVFSFLATSLMRMGTYGPRSPRYRKIVMKWCFLVERGRGFKNLEDRHPFDHAVEFGRGDVCLELTEDQYRNLLKK